MTTLTLSPITPVGAAYNTTPSYSGTFIPTIWSSKLNAKFYAASVFADICNRNWEGDIQNLGDKVVINNIPSLTISDYVVGGNLSYQTPAPSTIELQIDRAKYFGFNVSDVLDYQAKPDLMDAFSNDAAEQMRIVIDSTAIYRTFYQGAAANRGATAGVKSGAINLGSDTAPVQSTATANTLLNLILGMAGVLDEQNVPDSDRWLVIDPVTRTQLMQSNLQQAYLTGDATSPVRNGLIGKIDRFSIYVSNQLPTAPQTGATNANLWVSGDGSEISTAAGTFATSKRRALIAGHTSAISFASQLTKTEQLRNPTDFGDLVRGLQVFGHKVTKPEALALAVVY
jgi:hypothetical protein